MDNLVVLDREKLKPPAQGVAIDNEVKWKVGEAEFESLMRMLDNLVSELWPGPSRFLSQMLPREVTDFATQ